MCAGCGPPSWLEAPPWSLAALLPSPLRRWLLRKLSLEKPPLPALPLRWLLKKLPEGEGLLAKVPPDPGGTGWPPEKPAAPDEPEEAAASHRGR